MAGLIGPQDWSIRDITQRLLGSLNGITLLFLIFLQFWGVVVFFKDPICNVTEIHMFGKTLAWFFVIGGGLALCPLICFVLGATAGSLQTYD